MRLLVTGRDGQVARSLLDRGGAAADIDVIAVGRPDLDLGDIASVRRAILSAKPDIVVSAAAYTAVDQAESEPELAYAVNAAGAGAVAEAAAALGVPVLHLSTDYVFSGEGKEPYAEDDATNPQGVYGGSKLAGEIAVAAANPRHVILRTAWVYSPFGRNFVKTMLRLARDRDSVSVVSDQWGNPTSALDIADGLICIARTLNRQDAPPHYGIFHLAGTGHTNWSGLAAHVFRSSHDLGGPSAEVEPISSAEFAATAKRPANSRLDTTRLEKIYGWRAPAWQASCGAVVQRLLAEGFPERA